VKRSCRGSGVTGTEDTFDRLIATLDDRNWSTVLEGLAIAAAWLQGVTPADVRMRAVIDRLVNLAGHSKWEVRRAVAQAAAKTMHGALEPALAKLANDDNARVRDAARAAALRRRDWANGSAFGKQHEERINAALDDIEARFGTQGRAAVKRAAEQIANTFARELYHEVIKLISPLAASADRIRTRLTEQNIAHPELLDEAERIDRRTAHLRAVVEGMRSYTAQPKLRFQTEPIGEVIDDSIALVRDIHPRSKIEARVDGAIAAELCRERVVQALTNLVVNAVEACVDVDGQPVLVTAARNNERVTITITDHGCGMSEEALADCRVLFATSKPNGTGFGLPLAVKIVETEHDGRLTLSSKQGAGTVVQVELPVQSQRDKA
jgi:signal transduction histidine kinase